MSISNLFYGSESFSAIATSTWNGLSKYASGLTGNIQEQINTIQEEIEFLDVTVSSGFQTFTAKNINFSSSVPVTILKCPSGYQFRPMFVQFTILKSDGVLNDPIISISNTLESLKINSSVGNENFILPTSNLFNSGDSINLNILSLASGSLIGDISLTGFLTTI